jgi:hypothetical protein
MDHTFVSGLPQFFSELTIENSILPTEKHCSSVNLMEMKTADALEHWLTLVAFVISQYQAPCVASS